jgi:hypothetical protein
MLRGRCLGRIDGHAAYGIDCFFGCHIVMPRFQPGPCFRIGQNHWQSRSVPERQRREIYQPGSESDLDELARPNSMQAHCQ